MDPILIAEDLLLESFTPVECYGDFLRYYHPHAFSTYYGIRMDLKYGFWLTYEDEEDRVSVWDGRETPVATGTLATLKQVLDTAGQDPVFRATVARVKRVFSELHKEPP